jgi:hypothetical protein
MRRRFAASLAVATAALALSAPIASATFHLMSIREVYPGSLAHPGSEYVELQMWAGGQNRVEGHVLRSYDAAGEMIAGNSFPADVPHGANQSTLVLATPEAEAEFGILGDAAISPAGQLDPAGGAVCWEAIDCVSWGAFSGSTPSPTGEPATPSGIPDGMALRRTIAPNCATQLDPNDDRDNSVADFLVVFPGPRPNSVSPSEHPCAESGGGPAAGGPSPAGRGGPQTVLSGKPAKRTHDRTPTFRFRADEAGVSFECKLDAKRFRPCRSPFTTRTLAFGAHSFKVRARDDSGTEDPSPASYAFKVTRRPS